MAGPRRHGEAPGDGDRRVVVPGLIDAVPVDHRELRIEVVPVTERATRVPSIPPELTVEQDALRLVDRLIEPVSPLS